jgi:hypothetical protein
VNIHFLIQQRGIKVADGIEVAHQGIAMDYPRPMIITGVLKSERGRQKKVVGHGFEHAERGPQAKERRLLLEAARGNEMFSLKASGRNAALPTPPF